VLKTVHKKMTGPVRLTYICDKGALNPSLVVFGFIQHCNCFKILFTVSKHLVSNWSYRPTRL